MPINWNVRVLRGRAKYKNVYLAYLDVLGFKNLMKRYAGSNPQPIAKLFERIDSAVEHPRVSGLTKRYLSDSILIWCTHPACLPYLFDVCHTLQDELLREGCLVRGAIVFGRHYCGHFVERNLATGEQIDKSDEILVSPALIKAYQIESRLHAPVIKIERAVAKAYDDLFKGIPRGRSSPKFRTRPAKLYDLPGYLLSLRYGVLRAGAANSERPAKEWQRHADVRQAIADLKRIRGQILKGTRNADPRIRRKWKHVKRAFNSRVRPMARKWDLAGTLPI